MTKIQDKRFFLLYSVLKILILYLFRISCSILILVFFFLPACAFRDYSSPDQGTSAELQSILAQSLEGNMKEIPFDPKGKTVDLKVHALGSFRNAQGIEGYVKSLFREWIVGQGGKIGSGQFQMAVLIPVFGNTATRRDLSYQNIPFYYSERFQATTRLIVVIRDAEGKMIRTWQKGEGAGLSDIYLMRIFGPFDVPAPIR
jgi:hypothetical protein